MHNPESGHSHVYRKIDGNLYVHQIGENMQLRKVRHGYSSADKIFHVVHNHKRGAVDFLDHNFYFGTRSGLSDSS